jgi:valyl-tRNA synthetase
MDKVYNHKDVEDKIYKMWEEKGYFQPEVNPDGKPYSIILPPPNANAPLHFGHALMSVEDILIRYHRMKGEAALFLPGADHAGFETQFVFEKNLQKEEKSRFDYSREELYQLIWDHVQQSRGHMEGQLKKLGFSLDWSRRKFTLDPDIVKLVYQTFKKMYDEGLIYRDYRLVNYCTFDGTSFSDLEVVYEERKDPLYHIKYGPLVLATTRPETKFGDTGVAVNPNDTRYQEYVGKEIDIETVLGPAKIKVVADESVDPEFGTGVVKVTPAHDFTDFETGKRHGLPLKQVIGFDGKLNEHAGKFAGLYIKQARKAIVEEMQQKGLIEKIDENYTHRVALCYKCKNILEPLPLEQWFIKVKPLTEKAIAAVKEGKITIHPDNFETHYFQWLENLRDWNISRQTVWGMRIPAWKCTDCKEQRAKSKENYSSSEAKAKSRSNQNEFSTSSNNKNEWIVTGGTKPGKCPHCDSTNLEQDTDTFDTWFSSGQWPIVTLKTTKPGDFEKFYPTSVMETGYDILRAWVSRMVMLGIYITGDVPFHDVVLHGLVNDPLGKKMSKSKGNVIDPLELVEQFGADAVRYALVYGNATGNDQALSYPKLDAARKFTNKLWNMARFIEMKYNDLYASSEARSSHDVRTIPFFDDLAGAAKHESDKVWVGKVRELSEEITRYLDSYQFNLAAERLYEFSWHEFADKYIEDVKNRIDENSFMILNSLFIIQLKLLHPFMPFVTEEIYQKLPEHEESIMIQPWPATNKSNE